VGQAGRNIVPTRTETTVQCCDFRYDKLMFLLVPIAGTNVWPGKDKINRRLTVGFPLGGGSLEVGGNNTDEETGASYLSHDPC
jgi:hypothetical protein